MPCLLLYPASVTRSMLTFKLLPRCRLRDEQKCHCVMTNKQCLYRISIPLFIGQKCEKGHLHFSETWFRKPRAHTKNCRCDAWKCDIVPQIKVNPSKATRFRSYSLWTVSRTHTSPAAIRCLSSMYPSNLTSSSIPATSLSKRITGLTDSAGAESLPQLWRSGLVSNTDLCAISHRWLHLHTAL